MSTPVSSEDYYSSPIISEAMDKDYGISDAKKEAILSRLTGPSKAVRACDIIEDVVSDEESGTAQFFSNQLKSGNQKAQARSSTELKDGDPNGMEESKNTSGQVRGPTMPIPPTGGPGKIIGDPPPAGAIDSLDSVMEGPIPTTSPAGYGMYSPRRDGSDFQSIIWDASNGH
ncbi:hypothetical protein L1987_64520 [Smallanthus sonchifolius]|uniref:Uncharacterized protein n=1 Tax=Smallanthus sonchifolius TaxID=185202 RepID=A0ACB9BRZ3_9ASTR|nr:hypothetical protein L1987_64520 [Smallanthus sonchifolius]